MYCWSCNASNHCLHDISSSENSASKTAVPGSQSHETELGLSFSKHFTDWKSGLQLKRNRQHKVHLRVSRIQFIFSCVSYLVLYQCKWIYNSSTPKQQIAFEVNSKNILQHLRVRYTGGDGQQASRGASFSTCSSVILKGLLITWANQSGGLHLSKSQTK